MRSPLLVLVVLVLAPPASAQSSYSETFESLPEPASLSSAGWSLVSGTNNPSTVSAAFSANDGENVVKVTAVNDLGSQFGSAHVFVEHDWIATEPNSFGRGDALLWTTEPVLQNGGSSINLLGALLLVDYSNGDANNGGPMFQFAFRLANGSWWLYESGNLGTTTANLVHRQMSTDPLDATFTFIPLIFEPNQNYNVDARLIPNDSLARELSEAELASVTAVGLYLFPSAECLPTRFDSFTITNFLVDAPRVRPYCAGDGMNTPCPCGNDAAVGSGTGCVTTTGAGGRLNPVGVPSLSNDTFVLSGASMPDTTVIYLQGTLRANGGQGSTLGDGLMCVGGSIIRLGTKSNLGGASQYPGPGDPSVSVRGQVPTNGVRTYQAWFRDPSPGYCTAGTFNLTNGLEVHWQP